MRAGELRAVALDGSQPALAYEARKCSHRATEAQCRAVGLAFIPVVAEACGGGWAPAAVAAFRGLAARLAAVGGGTAEEAQSRLLQRLGVLLQRENARATLRRAPEAGSGIADA